MDRSSLSRFFSERRRPSTVSRSGRRKSLSPSTSNGVVPGEDAHLRRSTSGLDLSLSELNISEQDGFHGSENATNNQPRRNGRPVRKSFSSLRGAVDEFRSLPRRAASRKQRSFFAALSLRHPESANIGNELELGGLDQPRSSRLLRRTTSTAHQDEQRRSVLCTPTLDPVIPPTPDISSPVPGVGVEPPRFPYNPASGAAARAAAAAASNELFGSMLSVDLPLGTGFVEPKVTMDSESGIGIDLRDRLEDSAEHEMLMTRKDPYISLPEELMAHILSFLDANSLLNAELVSHCWRSTASSSHVWKSVFGQEFGSLRSAAPTHLRQSPVGGYGLGKKMQDQDWKQMWKTRKLLHNRWLRGHAAAIYLEGHKDSVYCVQFDEDKIITGSRDRTIRVWDARTYKCIKIIGAPNERAAMTYQEPLVYLMSRGHKPFSSRVPPQPDIEPAPFDDHSLYHSGSILCLQYDRDIMVTGSSDFTCIIWDMEADYRPTHRLRQHSAGVLDVCFDDKHIVSCSKDSTICLWDRQNGELLRTMSGHRGPVNAVQLRGNLVVSASGDAIAKLWNLTSGLCIKEFPSKDRGLACVEFSPDSRTILAGGNDQVIYQFDANTGELVRELKGHRGLVRSLHLDSANSRVISGSYDTSVRAYDSRTGDMICDFTGWTTSWILSAKADYRRIAATSQDSRVIIMDFGYQLPGIELLDG